MNAPEPDLRLVEAASDAAVDDRRFSTALARGLAVLRAFRPGDDGLGNADIAARTGLPKSTVSRLTFTLQALGYLGQSRRNERYRPGPALLALGNVAAASIRFVDLCAPLMRRLADDTGTLALLAVRDGTKMLLVRAWRPTGTSSLWLDVGHRLPLNRSSSGHALLAGLSRSDFERIVAEADGDRGLTPARAAVVRRSAGAQLTGDGFVIADPDDYFAPDIHAVSVPFRSPDVGEPVVFACGALPRDLTPERMRTEVGPALRDAVRELDRLLGQPSMAYRP